MEDGGDAGEAALYEGAVGDGADVCGVGGGFDVEADDGAVHLLERADEGFAQVAGAAGDEEVHRKVIREGWDVGCGDIT